MEQKNVCIDCACPTTDKLPSRETFFFSFGSGLRAHEGLNVTDEGEIFRGNIISVIEFQGRAGDVCRATTISDSPSSVSSLNAQGFAF